eukprot:5302982-Lingulodinium_polyedra.AAC.1
MMANATAADLIEFGRRDPLKMSGACRAVLRKGGSKFLTRIACRVLPHLVDGVVARGAGPPLI